jgi:hypothetical protein
MVDGQIRSIVQLTTAPIALSETLSQDRHVSSLGAQLTSFKLETKDYSSDHFESNCALVTRLARQTMINLDASRGSGSKIAAAPPPEEFRPPDCVRVTRTGIEMQARGGEAGTFETTAPSARGEGPGPGGRASVVWPRKRKSDAVRPFGRNRLGRVGGMGRIFACRCCMRPVHGHLKLKEGSVTFFLIN